MAFSRIKSERLRCVAVEAMRNEVYRHLSATNGNVKAAAMNLGYENPHSFYATLKDLGIKLKRVTQIVR